MNAPDPLRLKTLLADVHDLHHRVDTLQVIVIALGVYCVALTFGLFIR